MKIWLLIASLLIPIKGLGLLLATFLPVAISLLIGGLHALWVLDLEGSSFRSDWVAQALYFIYLQVVLHVDVYILAGLIMLNTISNLIHELGSHSLCQHLLFLRRPTVISTYTCSFFTHMVL